MDEVILDVVTLDEMKFIAFCYMCLLYVTCLVSVTCVLY